MFQLLRNSTPVYLFVTELLFITVSRCLNELKYLYITYFISDESFDRVDTSIKILYTYDIL